MPQAEKHVKSAKPKPTTCRFKSHSNPPASPSTAQHAGEKQQKEVFDSALPGFRARELTHESLQANADRYWAMRQLEIRVLLKGPGGRKARAPRLSFFPRPITCIA